MLIHSRGCCSPRISLPSLAVNERRRRIRKDSVGIKTGFFFLHVQKMLCFVDAIEGIFLVRKNSLAGRRGDVCDQAARQFFLLWCLCILRCEGIFTGFVCPFVSAECMHEGWIKKVRWCFFMRQEIHCNSSHKNFIYFCSWPRKS